MNFSSIFTFCVNNLQGLIIKEMFSIINEKELTVDDILFIDVFILGTGLLGISAAVVRDIWSFIGDGGFTHVYRFFFNNGPDVEGEWVGNDGSLSTVRYRYLGVTSS